MKLHMNQLSLKWKVFAYLLGFCALLLIILWVFQTVFLDSFYRGIKTMEIKSNAATIERNIDNSDLSDLITSISQDIDVSIEVMRPDGEILYSAETRRDSLIHKMMIQDKIDLVMYALSRGGEFFDYPSPSPAVPPPKNDGFIDSPPFEKRPDQALIYVKIVWFASGEPAAILLNATISPVNATVQTLRYQLYVITGIMFMLAIILAFIIAKRVSKPIEDINNSAKILAQGNYDINFSGKGYLEINELSDTLNTAATELSKVESLRRELMANISHDLRTPLSLIYSYAEMMHDFPDEVNPEQTQIIMDETQRLTSLVNDVLDISRLEAGIQQLNLSEVNLTACLNKITLRLGELLKKDGFNITFIYEEEVKVRTDEIKITQVFYNLLINAINYSGKNKTIMIRQSVTNETVRIEVADTGEGISTQDLPYIWDRYYKVDKNHKRAITGSGLGLYIVKQVMLLFGGKYGVESQVGNGSTFWFSLPRRL